jgi:hypothetical protein
MTQPMPDYPDLDHAVPLTRTPVRECARCGRLMRQPARQCSGCLYRAMTPAARAARIAGIRAWQQRTRGAMDAPTESIDPEQEPST